MADEASEERRPLLDSSSSEPEYNTVKKSGPTDVEAAAGSQDAEASSDEGPAKEVKLNVKYIIPSLGLGMFLANLDASVVNTIYVKIASEFQRLDLAPWVSTSFFLAMASCQPLYGKMSDILGRKTCVIFSYSVFALGCLFCGLSQSMEQFIAARVVQGCGASGIGTLITVLLSDVIPLRDRAQWQGYLNLVNCAGLALGAPVGGLFADRVSWRWSFLIQVPMMSLAVALVTFFLHLPTTERSDLRSKLRRIDGLGAILLMATVTCLLLGLDRASNQSWRDTSTIVPFALFPALLLALAVVETRFAPEPFLPRRIILNRSCLAVYANNLCHYGSWLSIIFYIPLFYQGARALSATDAGVRLLPGIFTAVTGAMVGGFVIKRTGRYYWLFTVSGLISMLAILLDVVATVDLEHDVVWTSISLAINSFFLGIVIVGSITALISAVSPKDQASATATMFLFRSLGSAAGVSISGTIVQVGLTRRLRVALPGDDPARRDAIVEGVRHSIAYIAGLDPATRRIVRAEYAVATRGAFVFMTALGAVGTVAGLFIREKKIG